MDSASLRAHLEKFTNLTPLKKWTRPTSIPATPQLMDSATLRAHFEKFTNLTPLKKWTLPNEYALCKWYANEPTDLRTDITRPKSFTSVECIRRTDGNTILHSSISPACYTLHSIAMLEKKNAVMFTANHKLSIMAKNRDNWQMLLNVALYRLRTKATVFPASNTLGDWKPKKILQSSTTSMLPVLSNFIRKLFRIVD